MSENPSLKRYNLLAQLFHWTVVVLMIGLFVTDTLREGAPKDTPERLAFLNLHMSFGILLFVVVIGRILWARISDQPAPVPGARWTQVSAKLTHLLLNIATLVVPVFGYLRAAAKPRPIEFFGTQVPNFIGESPEIAHYMHNFFHGEPMAMFFYVVIGLHVVAALWHQWYKRDGALSRMLPWG
ncbi:cytochrome b [uncultured Thiodictyon sp.]|uniref:cytochrome b n=1 Tax=uncultured Thiodictyon sp. TaxID=1846217 RepID=UPI0025DDA7E4|nr:cytochrome b [uncultured Thiodictyon sp.]